MADTAYNFSSIGFHFSIPAGARVPPPFHEWHEKFAKNSPSPRPRIVLMNSTRSHPRSILLSFFFFFPFFTSFQRFLSHLPGPRPLVEYLRRQAFAINSRWHVEAVSRADKRTFAADESRQILAPWNTIDRLQPLRLIAFEP